MYSDTYKDNREIRSKSLGERSDNAGDITCNTLYSVVSQKYNNVRREYKRAKSSDSSLSDGECSSSSNSLYSDVKSRYKRLKKIRSIERQMSHIHDKMYGIDKVIANLQAERVDFQNKYRRLQYDKEMLLDDEIRHTRTVKTYKKKSSKRKTDKKKDYADHVSEEEFMPVKQDPSPYVEILSSE